MLFSFIVPVYNRPDEVDELLASLVGQEGAEFEVVIVEDGSIQPCDKVVDRYGAQLSIRYLPTPNGGPSKARNIGAKQALGEWLVFLDSDVVLPPGYVAALADGISSSDTVLAGGPDRAAESFTPLQKGINYAMTSPLTTGGIRGGKEVRNYCPRTFNMAVRRDWYDAVGGFDEGMRFGEDIDFSLRIYESGGKVALLPKAWVYHKRRTDFRKFFKQVYNSGAARIDLTQRHRGSLKLVHLLPSIATLCFVGLLIGGFFKPFCWVLLIIMAFAVWGNAFQLTKSAKASLYAVLATFIQTTGYGTGLMVAAWNSLVHNKKGYNAFKNSFYK